jgi:hypothetical protein
MNTKMISLFIAIVATGKIFAANDWENTYVNSINRLEPRTYSVPLADEKAALTDKLEAESLLEYLMVKSVSYLILKYCNLYYSLLKIFAN